MAEEERDRYQEEVKSLKKKLELAEQERDALLTSKGQRQDKEGIPLTSYVCTSFSMYCRWRERSVYITKD